MANIEPYVPVSDELITDLAWARMVDPWTDPGVSLSISPDPLGSVNKIIRMLRVDVDGSRVSFGPSKLYPIGVGTEVGFGSEGSSFDVDGPSWRILSGLVEREPKPHVWYVTIDGKRILEVPYHLAFPTTVPAPPMPWYREVRWRVLNWRAYRARIIDRVAHRMGYQRIGECDCDE